MRHQEQQLNTAIEEEINIATRRRSSEIRAHMMAKEASYKDIVAQVVEKSLFLLKLSSVKLYPHLATTPPNCPTKQDGVKKDILTAVLRFVMMPGSIDDIKQLLLTKRSRYKYNIIRFGVMTYVLTTGHSLELRD